MLLFNLVWFTADHTVSLFSLSVKRVRYMIPMAFAILTIFMNSSEILDRFSEYENIPGASARDVKIMIYTTISVMVVLIVTAYGVLLSTIEPFKKTYSTSSSNRRIHFGPFNAYFRFVSTFLSKAGDSLIGSITVDDDLHGLDYICPVCTK